MSNDTDRTYVKLQVCGNDGSPDIQKDVDLGPDIMPSNSVNEKLENRYVEYARRAMLHLLTIT